MGSARLQRGVERGEKGDDDDRDSRGDGIACEKLALNGLVKLHTLTGDSSKVQMASEQLSEIEKETEEIKRTAK